MLGGLDGFTDAEKVAVTTETPFCVYSAAKAITTTLVHLLVERGCFSLDDRVCDYLPSYTSHGKDRTTIRPASPTNPVSSASSRSAHWASDSPGS